MPPAATPPEPAILDRRVLTGFIDWAVKGILGGLCVAVMAIATWAYNVEGRLVKHEQFEARITKIEGREDGYVKLAQDIAVLQTKLDAQDKQLDHITKLLEADAGRR